MHGNLLVWLGLLLLVYFLLGGQKGVAALVRAVRTSNAMKAVMAAYRAGDYETALEKAEKLKDRAKKTAEYCCIRGEMLHHAGRLDEAEVSLREALPLHDNSREKALVYDMLASVLMDQERYTEAIAFYETAGTAWPDRGSNQRGIAEAWLRQGRELKEAVDCAGQAVEIDRCASGMPKEALDTRLGEDLAVLAWAVAANTGNVGEVDKLVTEAFQLCGTRTKPILSQIHYHAGQAYEALNNPERAQDHFRHAREIDPKGIFARLSSKVAR
jgi:tetratricopeptide (TPR) repeat protein